MKEDAQLICPVSYEDPDGHWPQIEPAILDRLPLKEVTWKSPISSTYITINKLPLRFLPTDAKLFKDTDHPFRWFLSQYVGLYVVVAETLETYKIVKPNIKTWVDANNNNRGSFGKRHWVVIYLTLGNYPAAHYSKIFAKISSDFYFERSGDRTVILSLQSDPNSLQVGSSLKTSNFQMFSSANDGLGELMAKIREGIVSSFQVRSSLYYAEIRKLDATRATPNFDFKQLFLVKESFALQYQMMQLLDMALAQYEELEAMLAYAPAGILFDGWWPLRAPEQLNPTDPPATPETSKDIMADPVKNGDDIVTYSINLARMKVLKSKMNLLELYRYIFARQMFFLVTLHRPVQCAEKVRRFLSFAYQSTESKIAEIGDLHERATALMQAKVWALAGAVKCIRLCRDLIDNMIAAENVSGLESTQSVAAILNVVRNSTYRVGHDSEHRDSSLMASDRSNRDTHMAKDKMLAFRESFVLLGDVLQWAIKKFNELVPIKVLLRQHMVHSLHQTALFASDTLPALAEDAPNAVYFQLFDRSNDVRSILDKDLDTSSFSVAGGLEQVLSSISQRIRSVSHYWAKIYHMRSFEALAGQEDDAVRTDQLRKYMYLVQACRFQQPQIEKGRILEASLQALFTLAASEFNILCDRRSSALVERFHLAQHLLCTGQFLKTSQVLHGLMATDLPGATLFTNPWSSSWPDLMQTMLLMMARCAWELKDPRDFRKAVATLITLYIQQRDFFRADVHCEFHKVVTALIQPPEGLVYDEPLVIPAKGLFAFELERNIYAEETTPNESMSSPKQRTSRSASGALPWTGPLPACIATAAATKVIVPSSQVVRRKGMQLVHENPFPVQWLACICDQGPIPLHLKIQSHLQAPMVVDRVSVFFRRVPPQGFDNMFGSADLGGAASHHEDALPPLPSPSPLSPSTNDDASLPLPPPTLKSEYSSTYSMPGTSPHEDELVCSLQPTTTTSLSTSATEQVFVLDLLPRHLGDYVIDRYEICSGSLTFVHRVLDEYETTSSAALDFQQGPIVSDQDVQRYFDKCPIFRISPPRRILSFDVHTGSRLPPNQRDYVYVSFDVPAGDVIHELSVEVKAISRCRRWNGVVPKAASFEALSSMQYRAEWITSPARSFYRAGEERSSSIDETNLSQYMTRDFSVTVDNPCEWRCWEVLEGQSTIQSMSERELAVLHETLLLREITGGRRVVIKVPITVRTSLLTNIAEEFTLQSPLQVHVQGVVRKGDCFVPFHAVGHATLLCSNLLQSCRLQRVAMPRQRSLMQLQLHNIHQYPLRLLGNGFVSEAGELLQVNEEVQRHEVLCPADFPLVTSTEDERQLTVVDAHDVVAARGVVLEPNEDYHAFVQVGPVSSTASIAAWRVFYRREEDSSTSTSTSSDRPGVRQHVFWLDVPLEAVPSSSIAMAPVVLQASPISSPVKEARILPVVATQAPWTCTVGGVVLFRARVGLRGASFRYLVDSAENASFANDVTTADLSAFRSSFVFHMPTKKEDDTTSTSGAATSDTGDVRCELQECPAWMPLGLKVTKAPVTSTEYDILVAVVPVQVGVHSLPPLMIQRPGDVALLLIPHNASQLSHALIQPMRETASMEGTTSSPDLLTATTVLASFEEIPTI